jgi:hypothetical protein
MVSNCVFAGLVVIKGSCRQPAAPALPGHGLSQQDLSEHYHAKPSPQHYTLKLSLQVSTLKKFY